MIQMDDYPHYRERWYDQINPEQSDQLYSSYTYKQMEKETKARTLDNRDIDQQPK